MDKVRAKFRVNEMVAKGDTPQVVYTTVKMVPVFSDDLNSENKAFTKYTPSGSFEMLISVQETAAFFKPGHEYYVDFVRA